MHILCWFIHLIRLFFKRIHAQRARIVVWTLMRTVSMRRLVTRSRQRGIAAVADYRRRTHWTYSSDVVFRCFVTVMWPSTTCIIHLRPAASVARIMALILTWPLVNWTSFLFEDIQITNFNYLKKKQVFQVVWAESQEQVPWCLEGQEPLVATCLPRS